ncbi:hypothetical protein HHI36_004828, partial [Cryptolaemus montrouzieri]
ILSEGHQKQEYLNLMTEYGYTSLINNPTRVTPTTVTYLDHVFIRSAGSLQEDTIPFIYKSKITDHYAVGIQTVFGLRKASPSEQDKWTRRAKGYKDLKKHLRIEDWSFLKYIKNAEDITEMFISMLHSYVVQRKFEFQGNKRKNSIG